MNSHQFSQSHNMKKIMLPIMGIVILVIAISQYIDPQPIKTLIFPIAVVLITFSMLNFVRLEYTINNQGLTYKFRPFIKEKFIPATEIAAIHAIKISPLKEFGGWGFRFGRLGKAYTTSGKYILHIQPKEGKAINLTVTNSEDFLTFAAQHALPFAVSSEFPL